MVNSMEQYSKPLKVERTRLGKKYWLNPRRTKPGRELVVIYDQNLFLFDLPIRYSYFVRFFEKNNFAGNHYHNEKKEVFIPIEGEFEVHLENIITKENEIVKLNALDIIAFSIETQIAHKVVSRKETGTLLVLASQPSKDGDEVEYKL